MKTDRKKQIILSAHTLSGDKVVNSAGEELGHIEDFMLDLESGRIRYAVLSFGGVLGVGDKLFAVPPEALTIDSANKRLLLDFDKEHLTNAPGFDKDNWPDFANEQFGQQVYDHYDRRPYWAA